MVVSNIFIFIPTWGNDQYFSNGPTRKSMVFCRGSGGAPAPQSLTPIPAPRTVRRPHRPQGVSFEGDKNGAKIGVFLLVI